MLIDDLREATQEHHRRTEAALDLVAACASLDRYAGLLSTFYSIYRPLERRLDAFDWERHGLDRERRRKTPLLEMDLRALERDPNAIREADTSPIACETPGAAFGVLYVLEGSTLGGQYIRRHVARTLGLDATSGCAFFTGYGENTGRLWREFVDAANRAGGFVLGFSRTSCAEAVRTFELFEQNFRREPADH